MSQENVEIVRRLLRETETKRDEFASITAEFWDADCDYYPVRGFPDAVPRHGREELTRFMVQFHETWERFESPIKKLVAVGDDRVLAWVSQQAEGHGSGIRMEGDVYHCVWLRHGLIFRWEDHLTPTHLPPYIAVGGLRGPSGLSQTACDLLRIGGWALPIIAVLLIVVGLIAYARGDGRPSRTHSGHTTRRGKPRSPSRSARNPGAFAQAQALPQPPKRLSELRAEER